MIDARVALDRVGEIDDGARVRLRGIVRIERDRWTMVETSSAEGKAWAAEAQERYRPYNTRPQACDGLCAAILFTPGVEGSSLRRSARRQTRATRRFRRQRCSGSTRRLGCTGAIDIDARWTGIDEAPRYGDQLLAGWRTRISAGECVVRAEPAASADVVLLLTETYHKGMSADESWTLTGPSRRVSRIAIRDDRGVHLRRTMVWTMRNAVPLYVAWSGTASSASFGWGRQRRAADGIPGYFAPLALLTARTTLVIAPDAAATAVAARRQLAILLTDPTRVSSDPGFALTDTVLADIGANGLRDADRDLVERIVADPRTRDLSRIWAAIRALGPDAARLRDPIIGRMLRAPAGEEASRTLGCALASLPPGMFAYPTLGELTLLSDPARRDDAQGLIERQADRGASAAPMLLNMLQDIFRRRALSLARSGLDAESDAVDAIRRALTILGPAIVAERPRLEVLLAARPERTGRVKTWGWELALIRMGASPESFAKPSAIGGSEADYHRSLRAEERRFEHDLERKRAGSST